MINLPMACRCKPESRRDIDDVYEQFHVWHKKAYERDVDEKILLATLIVILTHDCEPWVSIEGIYADQWFLVSFDVNHKDGEVEAGRVQCDDPVDGVMMIWQHALQSGWLSDDD